MLPHDAPFFSESFPQVLGKERGERRKQSKQGLMCLARM